MCCNPAFRRLLSGMLVLLLCAIAMPTWAQAAFKPGTYYIVSKSTGLALQPLSPTVAQNVLGSEFSHGGTQKWIFEPVLDAKKRPTGRFTIRIGGPQKLYLSPHPSVPNNASALVLPERQASYTLKPVGDGYLIRSYQLNGDALMAGGITPDETRFKGPDTSDAFVWQIVPADD